MDDLRELRQRAAEQLAALPGEHETPTVMGFDGFVDNIIDVVESRVGPQDYRPLATIADFGQRVSAAAGRSANFELVVKQTKIGGNGPIMANALANLGHQVTYIGILGDPQPDAAFAPLVAKAQRIYSLGAPAATDALEFRDGKLMLGKLEPLELVNVESLRAAVGDAELRALFTEAACVATVNWTMLLAMNSIWQYLIDEVLPHCGGPRSRWFVDLADPAKRSVEDLRQALAVLGQLQRYVDVVLGLNEAEARQVLAAVDEQWQGESEDIVAAEKACVQLQNQLGLSRVVCHMVKGAAGAGPDGSAGVMGFYEPNPKITTGAGDHFNAGYLYSVAAGLDEASALLVGTATSGHYVRSAESPGRDDLIRLLSES